MERDVVAVVGGLGYWGTNLVRCFRQMPDVDVKVIDIKPGADYKQLESLVKAPAGVVIATQPNTHCTLTRIAADLFPETKILIEKPMVLTQNEIEALEPYANRIMVDHTFLFVPEFEYMRSLMTPLGIGKPLYAYSDRLNLGKFQDCGVLWDLAPHDIALFQWLFNAPARVENSKTFNVRYSACDAARVDLRYGAISAHLHVSWIHPTKVRQTTVVCEGGMVTYDMMSREKIKIYYPGSDVSSRKHTASYGEYLMRYRSGNIVSPAVAQHEPLRAMCNEFVDFMHDGETRSGFNLGRSVVQSVLAADK